MQAFPDFVDPSCGSGTPPYLRINYTAHTVTATVVAAPASGGGGGGTTTTTTTPPPGPTGQRAAALQKCKKLAKKKHWSHTRLKKCKKAANLLPV